MVCQPPKIPFKMHFFQTYIVFSRDYYAKQMEKRFKTGDKIITTFTLKNKQKHLLYVCVLQEDIAQWTHNKAKSSIKMHKKIVNISFLYPDHLGVLIFLKINAVSPD